MDTIEPKKKNRNIPIDRIEKLIELAVRHGLSTLKVEDVVIVPNTSSLMAKQSSPSRKLSQRQEEDLILFGQNGVTDEQ